MADRQHFLDGLRGLFSLSVLLFHVFFVVYAPWLPAPLDFGLIFDGPFAVHAFFVLSGMSLSIKYFSALDEGKPNADDIVRRMAAGRFFRLALPSLAACLLMYFVMRAGWNYYPTLPADMRTDWWTYAYGQENIRLSAVVRFALVDAFIPREFIPVVPYEGPYLITNLWTMSIEFVGSIFVFIFLLCVRDNRFRMILAALLALFLAYWGSYFAFFFAGLVATDLYLKLGRERHPRWLQALAIAVVLFMFIDGQPAEFTHKVLFGFAFITLVALCQPMRQLFGTGLFRQLGKISFALYLVHIPVLVSLQSYLTLRFIGHMPQWQIMAVAGGASVSVSVAVAYLFQYIDRWSVTASHRVADVVMGRRQVVRPRPAE